MTSAAPEFNIDPSTATVDVRVIDTTSWVGNMPTKAFFETVIKGFETIEAPAYSFLIEHPSGRKLLFDLGIRKDWESLPPTTVNMLKGVGAKITVEKGVREILEDHGVPASSIEAIVWSHWHFDHTGDPSTFDESTAVVVGPGFKEAFVPGYPTNPESLVLDSDFAGRELREIQFSPDKKVGRFEAFDYFGDGSFYLLNSPGHAVGHLCGFARVTGSPASYIFMGGDASHQAGEFRPSAYLPLPGSISPHPLEAAAPRATAVPPCPGSVFEHLLQNGDRARPFLRLQSTGGVHADPAEAERTIEKMQEADALDKVLVVIAHDATLLDVIDFFPKYASDFASKDWVAKGRWAFLKDFSKALL